MGEDGNAPSDITEQTILAYNNIRTVLAEFGANMGNIVDETFYVTDVQEVMTMWKPSLQPENRPTASNLKLAKP